MLIRPLSKELQEKAIKELDEVPSRLEEDVEHILEWGRQQPHLNIRPDPQWIVSFLRACKFSLQKTKEKFEMYYTFKSMAPDFFVDRNPTLPEIQEVLKREVLALLPREEEKPLDPVRLLIYTKKCDPENVLFKDGMRTVIMLADIELWEDDACVVNGQELIYDLGDLPYSYISQLTPKFIKSMMFFIQNAYPSRIKAIHFINVPTFAIPVVNLYTSFLSKKLSERVSFYSEKNMDKFREKVPKIVLPEEYGGEAGPISEMSKKLAKKFESYREWFLEDEKYGTDESKRIGKPRTADDFLNMEGSFRQLQID